MTPLQKLVALLDADGHADAALSLIEADHLMREYAFSRDPLTEKASEPGMYLRRLVADWIGGLVTRPRPSSRKGK
jgi:hypothetical protein